MMQILSISFCLISVCAHALFDYDRAIAHAQKNDFKKSQELLTPIIIDHPEKADALYDMGVSAYKNNEYQTALGYFNQAARTQSAPELLREQAEFNAGNTHVQLKQLHEAIAAYDRVLEKNPDHEKARANKEIVKKMLEEQKQQNKHEQQDSSSNTDKQEPNNSDSEQKQKDNQENNQDRSKQDTSDQKDHNQSENNPQDKSPKQNQERKSDDQGNEQKQPDENKSGKDKAKQQSQQNNQHNEQTPSGHDTQENHGQAGNTNETQETDNKNQMQKLPLGLARLLDEQEKKDARLNKQMTKALVANQAGGKHDYNCW